jgi:hypothetical protein
MSGGLLVNALLRETGRPVTREQTDNIRPYHAEEYARLVGQVPPCPVPASSSSTSLGPACPGPLQPAAGGRARSRRWTC